MIILYFTLYILKLTLNIIEISRTSSFESTAVDYFLDKL